MGFSANQKELMKVLATQKGPVHLQVRVKKYRPYTREFGSGCSVVIRELDPDTGEKWDVHYISLSKDRRLGIERAKKIAQFLREHGAKQVSCKAER